MKSYIVTRNYQGSFQQEVQADTEEEAIELFEQAEDKATAQQILDQLVCDNYVNCEQDTQDDRQLQEEMRGEAKADAKW